jgi:Arc/MetJ family transcription regulator
MKTTVDVDREVAAEAALVLGTKTLKDTVNAALREVVNAELRRDLADQILAGTWTVPTPGEVERLRAPKLPVGLLDEPTAAD